MEPETPQQRIRAFLTHERRMLISIRHVENMAQMPRHTLHYFLTGTRLLPDKHVEKLTEVLRLVGYQG